MKSELLVKYILFGGNKEKLIDSIEINKFEKLLKIKSSIKISNTWLEGTTVNSNLPKKNRLYLNKLRDFYEFSINHPEIEFDLSDEDIFRIDLKKLEIELEKSNKYRYYYINILKKFFNGEISRKDIDIENINNTGIEFSIYLIEILNLFIYTDKEFNLEKNNSFYSNHYLLEDIKLIYNNFNDDFEKKIEKFLQRY